MEFCPNCKNLLLMDRKRNVMKCKKCGYEKEAKNTSYRVVETLNISKETLIIKEIKEKVDATLPKTKAECLKCGNREAYYWMMQTRRADEAPTRFYRCTKCGHTWREYE
ncbi:MAG: transcription factor S [Candidatus Methanomethyliaceae archaeon]|nr:transcription factor S [Candidatus Methanomethyliaceae archaeon]MDW7970451.1 transcription factor S [Nitrososphaerota archaeon]